jgi:predicted NBD/HSP70 family sugar kinase
VNGQFSSRYRIVNTVRRHQQISRVEIAEQTGLSRSAITGLTHELLSEGLIKEISDSSPSNPRGRPRVKIALNPDAGYVVGVKLSLHQLSCAITDFCGEVLHALIMPFNGGQPPEYAADIIETAVRRCLADAKVPADRVLGLCVGIPGYVSHVEGICYWSPVFNQRDVGFLDLLRKRFTWECFIENDANLIALSEYWFGKGKDIDSFAVVTVEHGIGMGLIANGKLYRGAHGIGPEFGHSKIVFDGRPCRCGQKGCVEAYASDYAILRELDQYFSLAAYNTNPQSFHPLIERMTERALEGDEKSRQVFDEAGRWLGRAVGNLISILNPPAIFLTGAGMRAGAMLTDPVREEVRAHQLADNHFDTEIVINPTNDDVWSQGAAALVLEHLYREAFSVPPVEDRNTAIASTIPSMSR